MVGVGLYCESLFSDPFFSGGVLSTFIHLSLGKAGPFTKKESHIHVKALNMPMVPQIKKYAFGTCFSVGLQRCCQDLYFFQFSFEQPPHSPRQTARTDMSLFKRRRTKSPEGIYIYKHHISLSIHKDDAIYMWLEDTP